MVIAVDTDRGDPNHEPVSKCVERRGDADDQSAVTARVIFRKESIYGYTGVLL